MSLSLSEMKRKNKEAGQYFFQKGNPPVTNKYGNYLVTLSLDRDGWVVYKFEESNAHISFVDNPSGEYSWQPYKNKSDAVNYAKKLAKGN